MLAPRASSAFVCLRCEVQSARPRVSSLARRSPQSGFSTSARRHDAADEPQPDAPAGMPSQSDVPKKYLRISKEFVRKGKIVRQRKAILGMKRMDEDADVLVLNEAPVPEEEQQEPEVLEPISVPDIYSSLQRDSAPATQEDVEKQLEGLRPAQGNPDEPHYVTTSDFLKLVAALTRGFTTVQLADYYSTAKSIKKDTVFKVVSSTVKATKRSEWHPTTTNIEKRLPGVDVAKIGKKQKQKPKSVRKATLVDKILRDAWKLELYEELEAPGELELRLKEWELKLLQNGDNHSALARLARIRKAKVEIHWPTNILRITADKTTAEYMADDIEATLGDARTTSLDLRRWAEQLDEAKVAKLPSLAASLPVEYVSSLTGTIVSVTSNHNLKIDGLDEASIAEAKRTLVRLLPFKDSATRTIDTQKLDAVRQDVYLSPMYHEASSLDFHLRGQHVGRWALPITRAEDAEVTPESTLSPGSAYSIVNQAAAVLNPPDNAGFTGTESKPRDRQTGYWALEPEYKVSADFGQALFPMEMTSPKRVIKTASSLSRTPFHPAIPGLGSLLASSELQNISRTESPALIYEFMPSPDQKTPDVKIGSDFPRLFVQIRTGRNGDRPTLHKLSIGFHERIHDVLLPDQAADIRFHRYGRLRFSVKSHHDKNVEAWLEAVRENIESGSRLSAPSLTLDIPRWTIPGLPSDATGMLAVKYLFSGIQFRQSVSGRLLDTQVSYSTVQSGKLGAKGGALSAFTDDFSDAEDVEAQIRGFATKCVELVDYITQAAAQTQPLRQVVLPRNEHSARKQRRAGLQAGGEVGGVEVGGEVGGVEVGGVEVGGVEAGGGEVGEVDEVVEGGFEVGGVRVGGGEVGGVEVGGGEVVEGEVGEVDEVVEGEVDEVGEGEEVDGGEASRDEVTEAGVEEERRAAKSRAQEAEAEALLADILGEGEGEGEIDKGK